MSDSLAAIRSEEDGAAIPLRVALTVELVRVALAEEAYRASATVAATELATRLRCQRVSVGFLHKGSMRVEAMSHSSQFDPATALIRDLGRAMDEAADQDASVLLPQLEDLPLRVSRVHAELSERHGAPQVWTVPLPSHGRIVGALTFERTDEAPLGLETLRLCEEVASLLGPVLELRRNASAQLGERARAFADTQLAKVFGPDHPAFRFGAALGVALLLLFGVAKGTYRVTADATLEGRVQRAIVAGSAGYIAEAQARAGDVVAAGDVLGVLDERDLLLEQRRGRGRVEQLRKEHRQALASHDRSQVSILSARLAQADAQLALAEERLSRARLIAPFDGVVVRGDLSQKLGSPVEKGQVLFEIAPLDGYRIVLQVDERDIADVAAGQAGELELSALPGETLALTVERVTPVSTAEGGRNVFRLDARLEEPAASLRPGMEGVAKIEIDRRRLLWIWSHRLVDWFRLWMWSWWP